MFLGYSSTEMPEAKCAAAFEMVGHAQKSSKNGLQYIKPVWSGKIYDDLKR